MLKYVLLGFLQYQAATGYELEQRLSTSIANFWHANLSQIYGTLKTLEARGHVTSQEVVQVGRPNRRVYEITAAGLDEFRAWLRVPLTEVERFKNTVLLKVFFGGQGDKQSLLTHLRVQQDAHRRVLERYQHGLPVLAGELAESQPSLQRDQVLWQATLDWGLQYETAFLAWLETTIALVEAQLD